MKELFVDNFAGGGNPVALVRANLPEYCAANPVEYVEAST